MLPRGSVFLLFKNFRHAILNVLLILDVMSSAADSALGLDIACLGKSNLGKIRTKDLVNKNCKECDGLNYLTGSGAKSKSLACHTESNARLRKKGDTEVLGGVFVTVGHTRADACAEVLTNASECDVDNTDKNEDRVCKYGEIKLCTADNEEENEQGSCPLIRSVHKILREITDVAEYCTEHHACKKRRECDVKRANGEADAGNSNGSHYEGNRYGHTLGVGVEVSLTYGEEDTHNSTECDGKNNLENGVYKHRYEIYNTGVNRLCNTEGNCKYNKTYRVVKSNYGEQEVGERSLSLILLYNHEGCGGSGSGRYCAENDCRGQREYVVAYDKGEENKHYVYNDAGENSLEDTDDSSLTADLLKLRNSELVTNSKSDEAKCKVTEDLVVVRSVVGGIKADAESSEKEGADEDTRDKICGNSGKSEKLYNS